MYLNESVGAISTEQIREIVEEHIQKTSRKPVVFVDYLQILKKPDVRMSDKQSADENIIALKQISRDYELPVICISSLSRPSYKARLEMDSMKESGGIEYGSDVVMGLQYKAIEETEKESDLKNIKMEDLRKEYPRNVRIKVMKNREGITGATVDFSYYPRFNYFSEIESK